MAAAGGEVAVVGAGLIGLFSAHYLLERGHGVTLIDRGDPGGGASRVNGGWVCPARSDPLPSYAVVRDGIRSLVPGSSGSFFLDPRALPRVAGFLARFLRSATPGRFERAWNQLNTLNVRTAALIDELVDAGVVGEVHDNGFLMLHSTPDEAEQSRDGLGGGGPARTLPRARAGAGSLGAARAGARARACRSVGLRAPR